MEFGTQALKVTCPHAPANPSAALPLRTTVARRGPTGIPIMALGAFTVKSIDGGLPVRLSLNLSVLSPRADPVAHDAVGKAFEALEYVYDVRFPFDLQPSFFAGEHIADFAPAGTGFVR